MPIIIEIENISREFISGFKRKKTPAVTNVSLQIQKGEIFGIVGVNGAGKSTVLKMLLGFIPPDSGEILILGKSPKDPNSRKKIGYLPENPYFYDHLSANELLKFSSTASGLDKSTTVINSEKLLKQVGLFNVKNQKLRTYSKGMTQRAGLCFALVHDPEIVILDEPMSGLDPLGRKMVIDLISDLKKQGKTILFCSHILNDVERICDRVAVMDQGKLKTIFAKDQIQSGMEEIFLKTIGT